MSQECDSGSQFHHTRGLEDVSVLNEGTLPGQCLYHNFFCGESTTKPKE